VVDLDDFMTPNGYLHEHATRTRNGEGKYLIQFQGVGVEKTGVMVFTNDWHDLTNWRSPDPKFYDDIESARSALASQLNDSNGIAEYHAMRDSREVVETWPLSEVCQTTVKRRWWRR
jgi:hypothetical protein